MSRWMTCAPSSQRAPLPDRQIASRTPVMRGSKRIRLLFIEAA
jgi:hypothetical protein